MASETTNDPVLAERLDAVTLLRLNRPDQRNALSDDLLNELARLLDVCDDDDGTRCVVIAGSERVFAAGADVHALLHRTSMESIDGYRARLWDRLRARRTPLIAAVSGYCLGGGFELAMHADLIVASETATFGLPETQLGLLPGGGGTQLLARAIGQAKAMDVILTGRMLSAVEAEQAGVVSRVAGADGWLELALELAHRIAERPASAQRLARDATAASREMGLRAGLALERRAFATVLATEDAREGMRAFIEKRPAHWQHR